MRQTNTETIGNDAKPSKVIPESATELRKLLDRMYEKTRNRIEENKLPKFYNLIETMTAEATILSAIHKLKANQGSNTPGTDGIIIDQVLQGDLNEVITMVRVKLTDKNYEPNPIRRAFIPKPGSEEKRPLGIPSIVDRIIQQIVRTVIEPIFEAQFFKHSYGFRPMRDAEQAVARIENILWNGHNWVIEGDISKFFDNVDHRILIQKMWHMGIRDKRVLQLIKKMLQARIMDEIKPNELGTPQGGIISPLLANIYLHTFDELLAREWEEKTNIYMKSKNSYKDEYLYNEQGQKIPSNNLIQAKNNLKQKSNVKVFFLVRYADDWVILTNSKENAEKLLYKAEKILNEKLKLKLSRNKTKITNARTNVISFLGFHIKLVKGKSHTGFVVRAKPIPEKFQRKMDDLRKEIRKLRHIPRGNKVLEQIQRVNATIRGLINYFDIGSSTRLVTNRYARNIQWKCFSTLREHNPEWISANQTLNLKVIHEKYTTRIPAIRIEGEVWIGITGLNFFKHRAAKYKDQDETLYSEEGRKKYQIRTNKTLPLMRPDEFFNEYLGKLIYNNQTSHLYNFEYYLNRGYALNRDKFKCKCCRIQLYPGEVATHHIEPGLEINKVNKVKNLATVCHSCHTAIHSNTLLIDNDTNRKIQKYRTKLGVTV